jgi:hypothetical protein
MSVASAELGRESSKPKLRLIVGGLLQDYSNLLRKIARHRAKRMGLSKGEWQRKRLEFETPGCADAVMVFAPHQFEREMHVIS